MVSISVQLDLEAEHDLPTWQDLLAKRDFLGAVTMLQVKSSDEDPIKVKEWIAYCHFHAGQYEQACKVYEGLLKGIDPDPAYHTFKSACLFYMGKYDLAEASALKGPESQLQQRVLVHCAHAAGIEEKLVEAHGKLEKRNVVDQLCLAAVHFRRSHFQEATDIYKRLLLENKTYLALNVFIALCYSRLDYYDISQEILKVCRPHLSKGSMLLASAICAMSMSISQTNPFCRMMWACYLCGPVLTACQLVSPDI